ncbi:hypothetical protein BJP34_04625 [Moorena producens PAL-8-15-08-1]|uniref:Uncharacterized protein n=1 Tax=Moorena producens PAL-8-15-08-1 TaxID=1458985 RepID=A0A1D8TMG5_9CYAN|nr:hypothetical protein BJP34_04625 [Moorena producens PAL-8-15-08-1]
MLTLSLIGVRSTIATIAILRLVRYKFWFLGSREQGAGTSEVGSRKSEVGSRKSEVGKNNVYLMSPRHAI